MRTNDIYRGHKWKCRKGAPHIPVVDAKLLEAVDREVLEAGDVEDADVVRGPLEGNAVVDLGDDVVE